VELVPSHGGVFEVSVDGQLVYSKKATGLFPTDEFLLRDCESREDRHE